jgi:hypothetical protein
VLVVCPAFLLLELAAATSSNFFKSCYATLIGQKRQFHHGWNVLSLEMSFSALLKRVTVKIVIFSID